MSAIAISSFSLHRKLGPLRLESRDQHGERQITLFDMPAEHTLEQFAQITRDRLGVGAVELCQIQFDDSSAERIERLRRFLVGAGVTVLTVPIDSGNLSAATPQHRDEDIATIIEWFDIAAALGATYARVNTGTPHTETFDENYQGLVDALRQLSVHARERDLQLLVENHGGSSSDPDYLLKLRADVGADSLGILLDLGNFEPVNTVSLARLMGQPADDAALETEHVYAHIARLAPVATLVHAKAYDPRSDGTPLLDLDRALRIVADAGYRGSIAVEWEGGEGDPWERTAQTLDTVLTVFPGLSRG
ncbi:MAG: sugar phosphate isomerase/epimerase family protein [Beutenbergiaceae bacterium]